MFSITKDVRVLILNIAMKKILILFASIFLMLSVHAQNVKSLEEVSELPLPYNTDISLTHKSPQFSIDRKHKECFPLEMYCDIPPVYVDEGEVEYYAAALEDAAQHPEAYRMVADYNIYGKWTVNKNVTAYLVQAEKFDTRMLGGLDNLVYLATYYRNKPADCLLILNYEGDRLSYNGTDSIIVVSYPGVETSVLLTVEDSIKFPKNIYIDHDRSTLGKTYYTGAWPAKKETKRYSISDKGKFVVEEISEPQYAYFAPHFSVVKKDDKEIEVCEQRVVKILSASDVKDYKPNGKKANY